METKEKETT